MDLHELDGELVVVYSVRYGRVSQEQRGNEWGTGTPFSPDELMSRRRWWASPTATIDHIDLMF